jgi:hypothetical protein
LLGKGGIVCSRNFLVKEKDYIPTSFDFSEKNLMNMDNFPFRWIYDWRYDSILFKNKKDMALIKLIL